MRALLALLLLTLVLPGCSSTAPGLVVAGAEPETELLVYRALDPLTTSRLPDGPDDYYEQDWAARPTIVRFEGGASDRLGAMYGTAWGGPEPFIVVRPATVPRSRGRTERVSLQEHSESGYGDPIDATMLALTDDLLVSIGDAPPTAAELNQPYIQSARDASITRGLAMTERALWVPARGLVRERQRLVALTGAPHQTIAVLPFGSVWPERVSFEPPADWVATSPHGAGCGWALAVLTSRGLDLCADTPDVGVLSMPEQAAVGETIAWVWVAGEAEALPDRWLRQWHALAHATLPAWTARYTMHPEPSGIPDEPDAVAFTVRGDEAGRPVTVDALLVRRGGWRIGIAVASPGAAPPPESLLRDLAASVRVRR